MYGGFLSTPRVVLPPSQIPWIIEQPEGILSSQESHREALQADWTMLDKNIVQNPLHEQVIRENLVRDLGPFTDEMGDELRQCFEDYWGTDENEWRALCVYDCMLKFAARASNRIFSGLPLCMLSEDDG